jgi:hypothetical protein
VRQPHRPRGVAGPPLIGRSREQANVNVCLPGQVQLIPKRRTCTSIPACFQPSTTRREVGLARPSNMRRRVRTTTIAAMSHLHPASPISTRESCRFAASTRTTLPSERDHEHFPRARLGSGTGSGVHRSMDASGAGARPHRADPARHPGAHDPRRQARRHLQPLRRVGSHDGQGDRPSCTPAIARSSSRTAYRPWTAKSRPSATCTSPWITLVGVTAPCWEFRHRSGLGLEAALAGG